MIDFSINFANDVLTLADFSYRKPFELGLFCFGEKWENMFTFKSIILRYPKIEPFNRKKVACTPYLVIYLL